MKKSLLISLVLIIVLLFIPVMPVLAATSQNVTVTAAPAYVTISNSPSDWTIGGLTGSGKIAPNTTYYSNPGGDTTSPSATVVDGECRFTVDSTGSTVDLDLTVNFPNHAGGDASTNSDLGTNDTTKFGAYSYFSGVLFASKVIAKNSGSSVAYSSLTAGNSIKWGLEYTSQSNDWTSGTSMSSTVVITATAS